MAERLIDRAQVETVHALTELSRSLCVDAHRIAETSRATRAAAQRVRHAAQDDRQQRLSQRQPRHS
jgi:hypothetical protein